MKRCGMSAWQFKLGTNAPVQWFLVVFVIHHLPSPALRPIESVPLLALDINVHILHLVDRRDAELAVHASEVPVQGVAADGYLPSILGGLLPPARHTGNFQAPPTKLCN